MKENTDKVKRLEIISETFKSTHTPAFPAGDFQLCTPEIVHFEPSAPEITDFKPKVELLGISIDMKLTFDHHVSEVCRKAAGQFLPPSQCKESFD